MRRFLPKRGFTPQNIRLSVIPFLLVLFGAAVAAMFGNFLLALFFMVVLAAERIALTHVIAEAVDQMYNPDPAAIAAAMEMVNQLFGPKLPRTGAAINEGLVRHDDND